MAENNGKISHVPSLLN